MTVKVNVARSPEEADLQAQGVDVMAQMFERRRGAAVAEELDAERRARRSGCRSRRPTRRRPRAAAAEAPPEEARRRSAEPPRASSRKPDPLDDDKQGRRSQDRRPFSSCAKRFVAILVRPSERLRGRALFNRQSKRGDVRSIRNGRTNATRTNSTKTKARATAADRPAGPADRPASRASRPTRPAAGPAVRRPRPQPIGEQRQSAQYAEHAACSQGGSEPSAARAPAARPRRAAAATRLTGDAAGAGMTGTPSGRRSDGSSGERLRRLQGSGSDEYLREARIARPDATGGSDFASQGQRRADEDENEDETGHRLDAAARTARAPS